MSLVYRNGALVADTWRHLGADDALPPAGDAVLGFSRWLGLATDAQRQRFAVAAAVGDVREDQLALLTQAPMIVLALASFTDGRAYSLARRLRGSQAYAGELRASGDVLLDQIPLLARCGFDSFVVTHAPSIRALERGHVPAVAAAYQASLPGASSLIRPTLQRGSQQETAA